MRTFFLLFLTACGAAPEHGQPGASTAEPLLELPPGADLADVPKKKALGEITGMAVPGKVTVIDFWAEWCVPCRNVEADLHRVLQRRTDVAVRRVEIGTWDDPIAAKHLGGAPDLPLVVVLEPNGTERGRVSGYRPDQIEALLAR